MRATTPASFRGATLTSMWSTLSLAPQRRRARAFAEWQGAVEAHGFSVDEPDMVLGLTDDRIVVFRTSFWLNRPIEVAASFPLDRIGQVALVRHGLVTGLALALTNGAVLEVEALRGRRLRRFANEVDVALAERRATT